MILFAVCWWWKCFLNQRCSVVLFVVNRNNLKILQLKFFLKLNINLSSLSRIYGVSFEPSLLAFCRGSGTRWVTVQGVTFGTDQRVCRHSRATRHWEDLHRTKGNLTWICLKMRYFQLCFSSLKGSSVNNNLFLSSRSLSVLAVSVICSMSMEQVGLMNKVIEKEGLNVLHWIPL